MSLINDALRRAKHSQKPITPPEVTHALRPVESTLVAQRNSSNLLLPLLIVVLLVAGGLLIGIALSQRGGKAALTVNAKQPPPEAAQSSAQPVAPLPQTAPQRTAAVEPAPRPVAQQLVTQPAPRQTEAVAAPVVETAAAEIPSPQPVVAEVVPVKPPLPVVRGIFYNPTRPSAVLNSKTAFVGDSVAGFRVLIITRDSVTVVNEGVTNVLTLAE